MEKLNLQLFAEGLMTTEEAYVDEDIPTEEPVTEEVQADESEETTEELTPEQEAFLEIQYNKENIPLDREKAIEYAQKGMNYDKIYSRYQELENKMKQLENDPVANWAKNYMKEVGFEDPNEFLRAVQVDKMRKEYQKNGMSPEEAKRQAEYDHRLKEMETKLSEKEKKEKNRAEMESFVNWHMEMEKSGVFDSPFDAKNVPIEVWQAVEKGESLKTAYMEHALKTQRQKTEQETIKKLSEKKTKTPGSINSDSNTPEPDFTPEFIEKMVEEHGQKWIKDNWKKIEKSGYFD